MLSKSAFARFYDDEPDVYTSELMKIPNPTFSGGKKIGPDSNGILNDLLRIFFHFHRVPINHFEILPRNFLIFVVLISVRLYERPSNFFSIQ
ncbi:MAG TPA: hypothetical protein VGM92_07130 [Candidatus Kapabacteria bacterium]|jgi:hypothetical protein